MRIAMVGHKRVPSREGGIEVVVEELAARMVMHGHSVTCYNRTGHHVSGKEYDIEHLDEYRGIRLKRVPTIDRKGLAAASLSAVPLTAPKIRLCPSAVNGPAQIRQSPKIVPSFLCKNAPASCCGNRGVYNILLSLMLSAPHAITCGGS